MTNFKSFQYYTFYLIELMNMSVDEDQDQNGEGKIVTSFSI